MPLRYVSVEQSLYAEEIGEYRTFGIQCWAYDAKKEKLLFTINDISCNRIWVERLARMCTSGNLAPHHLVDVVLDNLL